MTSPRRLFVTGATGKRGGAFILVLLAKSSQPFEIYAITRSKSLGKAQQLAAKPNVKVIKGNLDNINAIFSVVKEEAQGKSLTAAAVNAGTSHIGFTSTNRGGLEVSENNPTVVPRSASKFRIEDDIKEQTAANLGKLSYTVLSSLAFFENMPNNFIGRAFASIWRLNGEDRKLQMISTIDIGKIAAEVFLNADSPEYKNRAISLAGDELSPREAGTIFEEEVGQEIPAAYGRLGASIRWAVADLRHMFAWFKTGGFGVDVPTLKKQYPFVKDFRTWLREESARKKV